MFEQAESILANSEASIPLLQAQLEAELNRLSVLVGEVPGSVDGQLEETAEIPYPDEEVIMGVPADLLRRRPDIRRAERQLAPPLVVEVEPDDLLPAGLGEFLDGQVQIVLVVKGMTTAAPLARLITPGTYVVQTADPTDLAGLAKSPHPGVALLFDEERPGQARFVHDPDAGDSPGARITLMHMPEPADVGRGRRAPIWLEELDHLQALARGGQAPTPAADVEVEMAAGEEATDADQLAAWLLNQTDLSGV